MYDDYDPSDFDEEIEGEKEFITIEIYTDNVQDDKKHTPAEVLYIYKEDFDDVEVYPATWDYPAEYEDGGTELGVVAYVGGVKAKITGSEEKLASTVLDLYETLTGQRGEDKQKELEDSLESAGVEINIDVDDKWPRKNLDVETLSLNDVDIIDYGVLTRLGLKTNEAGDVVIGGEEVNALFKVDLTKPGMQGVEVKPSVSPAKFLENRAAATEVGQPEVKRNTPRIGF